MGFYINDIGYSLYLPPTPHPRRHQSIHFPDYATRPATEDVKARGDAVPWYLRIETRVARPLLARRPQSRLGLSLLVIPVDCKECVSNRQRPGVDPDADQNRDDRNRPQHSVKPGLEDPAAHQHRPGWKNYGEQIEQ